MEKVIGLISLEEYRHRVLRSFEKNKVRIQNRVQRLVPEIEVVGIKIIGSYSRGNIKMDSDVDLLVRYIGELREEIVVERLYHKIYGYDGVFDILPEEVG